MHTALIGHRGSRSLLAAALFTGAFAVWWFCIPHHFAGFGTPLRDVAVNPQAPVAERHAPTTQNWFSVLIAPPTLSPKEKAAHELEGAGLPLTGDSFVRTVATGHPFLISLFLKAGLDVNAQGDEGRTALLTAAIYKDWEIFDQLLQAGANVNLADDNGVTPLMTCTAILQTGEMAKLIGKGAHLEAADANGHTALHYAVVAGNVDGLHLLLKAGAPCADTACGDGKESLLSHAYEMGNWQMVEPLLQRQSANLAWSPGAQRFAAKAAAARDEPTLRLLLTKYPAPLTSEGSAQPLLAQLLLAGDLAQFQFLLKCGAAPDAPLSAPVEKAFAQQVPVAFMRDYVQSETGITPLMLAAGLGKTDFMQALLAAGAKRGAVTGKWKMPALLFAARLESAPAMQMLIANCPTPEQLRVEISLSAQQAEVIRNGATEFVAEVSTGKRGLSTPTGTYVITDKHQTHRSTIYKCDMPFFMRLNGRDFGMHEGHCPGYPASHGCIRMPSTEVRRLFKEVPVGTLVSIRP